MAKNKNTDDAQAAPDDAYVLAVDGTVRLVLDGTEHRLRRPKVGEYRKLRERLWDLQDEKVVITSRHREEATARAKELKGVAEVEQTLDVRKRSRQLVDDLEVLNEQWVREVFDMLGDRPVPPAVDEWPMWLRESDFVNRLVEHWRSVP